MGLNIKCLTLTQNGTSTGSQTLPLGDGFDPKCGLVVAAPVAADGAVAHGSISIGYFSFRGGVIQQACTSLFCENGQGTADTYSFQAFNITQGYAMLIDGAGAKDFELLFTGLTTGVGSSVTFDVSLAHATSNIRVFIMVWGGNDVLDAQVHTFPWASPDGALDVSLGSGFGHPTVVFASCNSWLQDVVVRASADPTFGFAVTGEAGRSVSFFSEDAVATEATHQRISTTAMLYNQWSDGTLAGVLALASEGGFPTDGYEVTKSSTNAGQNADVVALAIKFSSSVVVTTGSDAVRTTIGTTDLAVSGSTLVPKGLLVYHTRQATADSGDTTSADAALVGVGMVDQDGSGRWTGAWDDDAQSVASVAGTGQTESKAICLYVPSTSTLDAEAGVLISGSIFQLDWTTAAPAAFLYEWIAFGVIDGEPTGGITGRWYGTGWNR